MITQSHYKKPIFGNFLKFTKINATEIKNKFVISNNGNVFGRL